jgi:hypothetical protein
MWRTTFVYIYEAKLCITMPSRVGRRGLKRMETPLFTVADDNFFWHRDGRRAAKPNVSSPAPFYVLTAGSHLVF